MGIEISFIIPCFNEQDWLPRLLKSLISCKFNFDLVECIIVDNGSTDNTIEVLWEMITCCKFSVRIVHEPRKGVSLAKNAGALAAKGKTLVFVDADNLLTQEFINNLFYVHYLPDFCGATIRTLAEPGSPRGGILFFLLEAIKMFSPRPFGKSVVRRDAFFQVGGFDTKVKLGENVIFTSQLKRYALKNNRLFLHLTSPIYCSLRRFKKVGYIRILIPWVVAYIGNRNLNYNTIDEL